MDNIVWRLNNIKKNYFAYTRSAQNITIYLRTKIHLPNLDVHYH